MSYFIRYTETPKADVERGHSFHRADFEMPGCEWCEEMQEWVQELDGLCVFELGATNKDEAIEEAKKFNGGGDYSSERGSISWCVIEGNITGDCPEGVLIRPKAIVFVEQKKYFEE